MQVSNIYVLFEKRKQNHDKLEFHINNEKIEIVDNFVYLGIKFTHTGNLIKFLNHITVCLPYLTKSN